MYWDQHWIKFETRNKKTMRTKETTRKNRKFTIHKNMILHLLLFFFSIYFWKKNNNNKISNYRTERLIDFVFFFFICSIFFSRLSVFLFCFSPHENRNSSLPKQQQEQDPTNLYIANLPPSFKETDLENLLSKYGQVISTRILRDQQGQSKGEFCDQFNSSSERPNFNRVTVTHFHFNFVLYFIFLLFSSRFRILFLLRLLNQWHFLFTHTQLQK